MHHHPPIQDVAAPATVGEALRREHRAVLRAVSEVRRAFEGDFTDEEARGAIASLLRHLEAHFEYEEEGGYMDAVLELEPCRAAEVSTLRADHARILGSLAPLAGETAAGFERNAASDVLRRALDELEEHERRENTLLLETLLRASGGE